jgi:hypothetical protein
MSSINTYVMVMCAIADREEVVFSGLKSRPAGPPSVFHTPREPTKTGPKTDFKSEMCPFFTWPRNSVDLLSNRKIVTIFCSGYSYI